MALGRPRSLPSKNKALELSKKEFEGGRARSAPGANATDVAKFAKRARIAWVIIGVPLALLACRACEYPIDCRSLCQ